MPSPGDVWCLHGSPSVGLGATIFIDAVAILNDYLGAIPSFVFDTANFLGVVAFNATDWCATAPVYPEDLSENDGADFLNPATRQGIIDKYTNWVKFIAFANFCVCDTYPTGITVQPPPPAVPTTSTEQPSLCTPRDLTSQLAMLRGLLQQVLLQEQLIAARVGPVAYTLGNTHTVSGIGEITVSGICGVITHALSYAPGTGYDVSDPTRFFQTGTVSFGDSNGWYPLVRLSHDPQLVMPAPAGTVKVAFDCEMVTSLEVTELIPILTGVSTQ